MHGDKLIILTGLDKGKCVWKPELQAHNSRQNQGHNPHRNGRYAVLNGNNLVVLTPDVFRDKTVRVRKCLPPICQRNMRYV